MGGKRRCRTGTTGGTAAVRTRPIHATVLASRRRLEILLDIAPAILLCLLGLVELMDSPLNPEARPQHLLAVVVTTGALAVRRYHPLTVSLGVATAMALTALGAEPSDEVAVLLALIIAVYSAAAYLPLLRLAAAAAANSAALVVAISTSTTR